MSMENNETVAQSSLEVQEFIDKLFWMFFFCLIIKTVWVEGCSVSESIGDEREEKEESFVCSVRVVTTLPVSWAEWVENWEK